MGNTIVEMVVVIGCNLLNILLNWIFIWGHWGAPELGALGAGVATLISRCVMPVAIAGYCLARERYRAYLRGFSLRRLSRVVMAKLLKIGSPIALQMFLEGAAFFGTSIMMGWISKTAITANQIAMTMTNCAFMIIISISPPPCQAR